MLGGEGGGCWESVVTSVLSLSHFSSPTVYHPHILFQGTQKTGVGSEKLEHKHHECDEILKCENNIRIQLETGEGQQEQQEVPKNVILFGYSCFYSFISLAKTLISHAGVQ